jgi:hypothetical protein
VWVCSGPFGGKTTLYKALLGAKATEGDAYDFTTRTVVEGDEVRRQLPGWHHTLWGAWRSNHPQHRRWLELDKQYQLTLKAALATGGVVITHDLPPGSLTPQPRLIVFIMPTLDAVFERMDAYCNEESRSERLDKWASQHKFNQLALLRKEPQLAFGQRLQAAAHYWTKDWVVALRRGDAECPVGVVKVATSDEALVLIRKAV